MKAQTLKEFNPIHPGEFIRVTYCEPLNIDIFQLSKILNQDLNKTEDLLRGLADVTPELASLLSMGLGRSQQSWLIMQNQYDEYSKSSRSDVN